MALSVEARGAEHQPLRRSPRHITVLTHFPRTSRTERWFETSRSRFSQITCYNIILFTLSHARRETKFPNSDPFPSIYVTFPNLQGAESTPDVLQWWWQSTSHHWTVNPLPASGKHKSSLFVFPRTSCIQHGMIVNLKHLDPCLIFPLLLIHIQPSVYLKSHPRNAFARVTQPFAVKLKNGRRFCHDSC